MPMISLTAVAVLALLLVVALGLGAEAAPPGAPKTVALLEAGQPVTVVGFGDSITGIYYHTGGRRAWPEMLGIALSRLYPTTKVNVVNAGISGNDTNAALARMDADVLAHHPQLVVVMFGMNDVTRVPQQTYEANLKAIITRCRSAGAEVVLCTPNSIYPEDGARPAAKLAAYAESVRRVGAQEHVPVADCYRTYEQTRERDRLAWMLLLSETIHPNMRGHKVFAEEVAEVVAGRPVSVQDVPPLTPAIPHTLGLLARGEKIRVIAMPPADALITASLQGLRADAKVEVISWPTAGKSLAELEAWSRTVREQKPDLVVLAVPSAATGHTAEEHIRSLSWVLNWSLSFGLAEWDCVALLPSVFETAPPPNVPREALAESLLTDLTRHVVAGQDIGWLERRPGDTRPPEALLGEWLKAQAPQK